MDKVFYELIILSLLPAQSVHIQDVKRVMGKYIWDSCPAVAAIGPTEAMPDYAHIRAKMYKTRY